MIIRWVFFIGLGWWSLSAETPVVASSQASTTPICTWSYNKGLWTLHVPLSQEKGLAIYKRKGVWNVAMETEHDLEVALPPEDLRSAIQHLHSTQFENIHLIQMALPEHHTLSSQADTQGWHITLYPADTPRPHPSYVWVKNLDQTALHLSAPHTSIQVFQDPMVGDTCVAILSHDSQAYQNTPFSCLSFDAWPTVQGYALSLKDPTFNLERDHETIRLPLSDSHIPSRLGEANVSSSESRLAILPFSPIPIKGAAWTEELGQLQTRVAQSASSSQKHARLSLAFFYLTTHHYVESLSELNALLTQDPLIIWDPRFRAYRGAVYYFMNRHEEALKDFHLPSLEETAEIQAWITLCQAQVAPPQQPSSIPWSWVQRTLSLYPRHAFEKIAFSGAQHAHYRTHYHLIYPFLNLLQEIYDPSYQTLYHDLKGYDAFHRKDYQEALDAWATLAGDTPFPYRGLAQVAKVMCYWKSYQEHPEEAIKLLESARTLIKDEPIRRPTLEALALLYELQNQPTKALSLWFEIEDTYGLKNYTQEIIRSLEALLKDERTFQSQPLQTVGLFERSLRHLEMQDPQVHDVLMSGIQRLMALSLWERACTLLQDLTLHTPPSPQQSHSFVVLADLFFKRGSMKQALEVVEQGLKSGATEPHQASVLWEIKARILYHQGQTQEAETLLKTYPTPEGQTLLADWVFEQKRWAEAFELYHHLIGTQPAKPHDPSWLRHVLNMAVVASSLDDADKKKWVYQTFSTAVQGTSIAESFDVLVGQN